MPPFRFSQRVLDVPVSGIGYMTNYAAQFPDVLSLGQGTPIFPTPEFIYDYVRERARREPEVGMYSSPKIEDELKELIALEMKSLYGFGPNRQEIYLTVGGIGALFSALMVTLEKGDEAIYFDPSYPLHLSQIYLAQAQPIFVSLIEEAGWRPDLEKLKRSLTAATKVVILTNPNNPTGTVWTKDEVSDLAQIILRHNLILILDEAYDFLTYDRPLFSPLKIPEMRKNIILCKSFSKEYAMTGWRLGYAWSNEEIIKKINDVHNYFSISPPTPSIVAGIAALSDRRGQTARQEFKNKFTQSREVICQRLDRLQKLFVYQKPSGAYYVFPKILGFENLSTLEFAKLLVEKARVTTIPGSRMGPAGERHLRLSFAASADYLNRAFDRLDAFARSEKIDP